MNSVVSIASLASASALSLATPASATPGGQAELARVLQIIELLRERYVCAGWSMNEQSAALAVGYFERRADGMRIDADEEGWQHAKEFISDHGQSFDWVLDGDPSSMICQLAGHSRRAAAVATAVQDDPIFALIEAHKAANARFLEAARDDEQQKRAEPSDEYFDASDALFDAADDLAGCQPDTIVGIAHQAAYIAQVIKRGDVPFEDERAGVGRLLQTIASAAAIISIAGEQGA